MAPSRRAGARSGSALAAAPLAAVLDVPVVPVVEPDDEVVLALGALASSDIVIEPTDP